MIASPKIGRHMPTRRLSRFDILEVLLGASIAILLCAAVLVQTLPG
jgi:hypothetical protein